MDDALTPGVAAGFGLLTTLVGGMLAGWGALYLRRLRRKHFAAQHTTGVVVENKITIDIENSTLFHPIVEFTTMGGRTLRVQCLWSTQLKYPVGTTVQLYYDAARPESAGIVGQGRLGGLLVVAFGASVFVFGLTWLVSAMIAIALGR